MRTAQDTTAGAQADGESRHARAAWTHDVRIRALARRDHRAGHAARLRLWGWLLALALHLLLVVGIVQRSRHAPAEPVAETIRVELLDAPAPLPALPQPPARAPRVATPAARARAPAPVSTPSPLPTPPSADPQAPRLFDAEGSPIVPGDLVEQLDRAQPLPGYIARSVAPSPLLQPKRPLKVRPNHFAQYWDDSDSLPLHDRMWRHVLVTRQFDVPWGGQWACAWVLILVACADVPRKPWNPPQTWKPATELDER
jgi:hypothetical protein